MKNLLTLSLLLVSITAYGQQQLHPDVIPTIDNEKLADVPQSSIKGRTSAGSGDPQDFTIDGLIEETNIAAGVYLLCESGGLLRKCDAATLSSGGSMRLSDLVNVGDDTATSGNALIGNGTLFESRALVEADISDLNHYNQLVELDDIADATPTNRNVLVADGTDFHSRPLTEADISDLSHPTQGSDIALNTASFNNHLSAADDTVQKAMDTLDEISGGGGGGTDDQTATEVPTDTAGFNGALTASETNVQLALDRLDNVSITVQVGVIGEVINYAADAVPSDFLGCGGAVSRTTYADLFSIIGTTWGAGDGSTTFNLPPDGAFFRGSSALRPVGDFEATDNLSHAHGASSNSDTHNHTITVNNDTHSHSISVGNDTHTHGGQTDIDTHAHNFKGDPGTNAGSTSGTYLGNTRKGDSSGLVNYTGSVQSDAHSHFVYLDSYTHNHSASAANDTHNHSASSASDTHDHVITVNASGGAESRPNNYAIKCAIRYQKTSVSAALSF